MAELTRTRIIESEKETVLYHTIKADNARKYGNEEDALDHQMLADLAQKQIDKLESEE